VTLKVWLLLFVCFRGKVIETKVLYEKIVSSLTYYNVKVSRLIDKIGW